MPEIDIRAAQQPAAVKRFTPEELGKTEYRLQQFFRKQAEDVYVQMGKNEKIRQEKIKEVNDKEIAARKALYQQAHEENQQFDKKARRVRAAEFAEATAWNKKLDTDKRLADRTAASAAARTASDTARKARLDADNKRREDARIYADASRDNRKFEADKNRDAREEYAAASAENKAIDAEKRRDERDRIAADRRATRDADRAAAAEIEYRRTHNFMHGAAIGGGIGAIISSVTGGAGALNVIGTGASTLAGGVASAMGASEAATGVWGMIADAIAHVIFNPAGIANALTKQWQDYRLSALDLSRAAGQPGEGAYNAFFPGNLGAYDDRLRNVGLGPQSAIKMLSSLGVVPTDANRYVDLATTIKGYSMSSAFALMKPGTVEGLVGQGMGQGNLPSSGAGAGGYINSFGRVMEEAVSRGMDRTKILDSIQGQLEIIAKSGALGTSPEAAQEMAFRFMKSGMVGGRTGEQAATMMAGIQGAMSDVTGHPLLGTMLMTQLGKFGNVKTAEDIRKLVGEDAWSKSGATPESAMGRDKRVGLAISAAQHGRMAIALQTVMEIAKADPRHLMDVLGPVINQATGGQPELAAPMIAQMFNVPYDTALGYVTSAGAGRPGIGVSGGQVGGLRGRGAGAVTPGMMAYDNNISQAEYVSRLVSMGISPDAAKAIVQGAKAANTNPYMVAAIGQQESGNVVNQGWNAPDRRLGKHQHVSYGPMQINQMNWAKYPGGKLTGAANYQAGADLFQDLFIQSGGNIDEALARYRGMLGTTVGTNYAQAVEANFKKFSGMDIGAAGTAAGGGFDTDILKSRADEEYQIIQTTSNFKAMVVVANEFSDALKNATTALANFARWMNSSSGAGAAPSRFTHNPSP